MSDVNFIGHIVHFTASATGDTDVINAGRVFNTTQVVRNGTAGFSVTVTGSLDKVNWHTIATVTTSGTCTTFNGPYPFLKFNVGTLGASETVDMYYTGS